MDGEIKGVTFLVHEKEKKNAWKETIPNIPNTQNRQKAVLEIRPRDVDLNVFVNNCHGFTSYFNYVECLSGTPDFSFYTSQPMFPVEEKVASLLKWMAAYYMCD